MVELVLTFDLGNTNPHVGFYKEQSREKLISLNQFDQDIDNLKNHNFVMINANVGNISLKKIDNIQSISVSNFFKNNNYFDMPVHYAETIGEDRLVEAFYIYKKFSTLNTIIIDAGSFITVDHINQNGFCGGYIFLGTTNYLKSYSMGAKLPFLTKDQILNPMDKIPQNTNDAILNATKIYLQSILKEIISTFSFDQIILTGGDAHLLKDLIHTDKKVIVHDHLIHDALYFSFQYFSNQENK